jgi:8-oxo-dGTP pyrophosphatase MutT (NUDIX family)
MADYIDKLAFIYLKGSKVLVTLSKGKDVWYIPGGKREPGESDEQALAREVKEELSVDLLPETIQPYGVFEAQAHGKAEGVIVRMTCYTGEFTGELTAAAEIDRFDFFTADQVGQTSDVDHLIFTDLKGKGLIQ